MLCLAAIRPCIITMYHTHIDREVACSASDRQGSNFESCVWRTVSSQSSHHPQEVLLAQFSLYVHKGGLKPDSFHFYHTHINSTLIKRACIEKGMLRFGRAPDCLASHACVLCSKPEVGLTTETFPGLMPPGFEPQ